MMSKRLTVKGEGVQVSADRGRRHGRAAGFARGWKHGFHIGQCHAALRHRESDMLPINSRKIIYVCAGIDVPYPALDQAIIDGLKQIVTEVIVTSPTDDIVVLAKEQKPDLVLVLNGVVFAESQVRSLREAGFLTAVWFTDDPYYTDWTKDIAPRYDYVFTLELSCVAFYESLGCTNVYYLPFAANPAVFHPKRVDVQYHTDICFIGTAFWNRVKLIDDIADYLVNRKVVISGWWWDRLTQYSKLAHHIHLGEWMSAEETASYYNGAKIVINFHRDSEDTTINFNSHHLPAYSLNPRTFEIASCGSLQLTDIRQDLAHFFTPGQEIATFTTADELIAQLDYYLQHEEERESMAIKALTRTRQEHTYVHRLTTMLLYIFDKSDDET